MGSWFASEPGPHNILKASEQLDSRTVAATLTFVLGLLGLIFIIVSFEYHMRRVGTTASRKLFVYSLSTQLTLFLVGYLLA